MEDVAELSSMLQEELYEKAKREKEIFELEGAVTIEANRYAQEAQSYREMLGKKAELKQRARNLYDTMELSLVKLQQTAQDIKRTDDIDSLLSRTDRYIKEKNALLCDIDALQQDIDLLEDEIDELEDVKSSGIEVEVNALLSQRDSSREQLDTLTAETEALAAEDEGYLSRIEHHKKCIGEIQESSRVAEEQLQAAKEEILSLDAKLQGMREDVGSAECSSTEKDLRIRVEELRLEIVRVTEETTEKVQRLAEADGALEALRNELTSAREETETINLKRESIKREEEEKGEEVRRVRAEIRAASGILRVTKSGVEAQQRVARSYLDQRVCSGDSKIMEQEIETLREGLKVATARLTELQEQMQSKSSPELLDVLSRIRESNARKEEVLSKLLSIQKEASDLEKNRDEKQNEVIAVERQIDEKTHTRSHLQKELDSLRASVLEIEQEAEKAKIQGQLKKEEEDRARELERNIAQQEEVLKTQRREFEELTERSRTLTDAKKRKQDAMEAKFIDAEVDKRLEKKKSALRTLRESEINQMRNKMAEADEFFKKDVKEKEEAFIAEKKAIEEEIRSLKS